MDKSRNNGLGSCVVVKFGGSSLADGNRVANAVKAVAKEQSKGGKIVVVVSAMGKTTDFLLDTAKQAINCNPKLNSDIDDILAMGERTSARIFAATLKANGVKCRYFDPADPDWPIITNGKPTNADPILPECEKRIVRYVSPLLKNGNVVVIPGFIGKTMEGKVTTMGRGGSDITALVVARALRAKQVVLATDVDGIMTADPKLVKSARKIEEIDVNSLIGLASTGQKFLQRKALRYKDPNIDVKVVNSAHCDLSAEGTVIKGSFKSEIVYLESPESIASITIMGKSLSQSPQVLHKITRKIKEAGTPLLGMSANYDSLILYTSEKTLSKILEQIHSVITENSEALAMAVRTNLALLKVKTMELEETPGIVSRIAQALHSKNINIYGIFTITSGIQVFVDMNSAQEALTTVKEALTDLQSESVENQNVRRSQK